MGLVIYHAWRRGVILPNLSQLMTNIKYTKVALKDWNRKCFGHVQFGIVELKTVIESFQQMPPTELTMLHEDLAQKELEEILRREQIMWQEMVNTKWLLEGDTNTHFSHLTTIAHRRHNRIQHIFDEREGRVSDPDLIGQLFVNFYSSLFQSGTHCFPNQLQDLIPCSIATKSNTTLLSIPEWQEIKSVIAAMSGHKSSGLGRMSLHSILIFGTSLVKMWFLPFVVSLKDVR